MQQRMTQQPPEDLTMNTPHNSTIYNATACRPDVAYPRPCIVLVGHNRQYAVGDIAYRVARPLHNSPQGPYPATLPNFAGLLPVMFVDGEWRNVYATSTGPRRLIKQWSDECTVIEYL